MREFKVSKMKYDAGTSFFGYTSYAYGFFYVRMVFGYNIFKEGMLLRLHTEEVVVTDNGYSGPKFLRANDLNDFDIVCHERLRV